ncbi:hypothetical protein [Psychroflexus sp. ALD_RP9]|uniref:hypothetical protein n=1 Tax=Psychroflexus sp. ALD_RP9 TaxID=2777186 RepID=UPI001A8DBF59|nr:hypothetical protein [Psychroflexus sp. ALD_RP9]QSS96977.1 hypothetical protein IMZ30_11115 [Psychroflexus sp. ALD_RP9]
MKLLIAFLFASFIVNSQEIPLNSSNFNKYIKQVYLDQAETIVFSNPVHLKNKKALLKRVFIINNVKKPPKPYNDFGTLQKITTYNKELNTSLPDSLVRSQFNPFLYKMDIYNDQTVFYYYSKSKQLIKIYPSKQ